MKYEDMTRLQSQATEENRRLFPDAFGWSDRVIELLMDVHVFMANDPGVVAIREETRDSGSPAHQAMNVIVNLDYDALGSLISAMKLMESGVLSDAWSLIRGAFESTCSAEFFRHHEHKVRDYLLLAEPIKIDRAADTRRERRRAALEIGDIITKLQELDGQDREGFYGRLSNFGTHVSPVRSGIRTRVDEPEVTVYLSIGHRDLKQGMADYAATAKYAMGIPFETWPELFKVDTALVARHSSLEKEYAAIFESEIGPT